MHDFMPHAATRCSLAILALLAGCAGPSIRSQSPEAESLMQIEAATKLVGDYSNAWGLGYQRAENAGLVTGLAGTGSDPPPSLQRQALMADMQAREVVEPNKLLASPTTSLVWAHGFIPPGARKGDRFDVVLEVPSDNDTTSLAGGWLMETRLSEMAVLGNRVRDGHMLATAEGPVLVDPVSEATRDGVSKLRARIPGGGIVLTPRHIGLVIAAEHRSVALSKRIGDCINRRFHTVVGGAKRGVANPKTDRFIELEIPPSYAHALDRYIRVVRSIAINEPAGRRLDRLDLLSRQLSDPVTAPHAALRLEAIGKDSVVTLRAALESKDPEVRFHAAEALAYLGESIAAEHLAEAAAAFRTVRAAALDALAVLDDANGLDALEGLLDNPSAETRYGAFRTLWRIDPKSAFVRGERLGDAFSLHVLDVKGPPLVHATRSFRPEIVLFGTEHPLEDGLRAEAGPSIVVTVDRHSATVSRFAAGEDDRSMIVPARVDRVIRAIAELEGTYPDVVQFLQQAKAMRSLASRLAFDAVPAEATPSKSSLHEEATAGEETSKRTASETKGRRSDQSGQPPTS